MLRKIVIRLKFPLCFFLAALVYGFPLFSSADELHYVLKDGETLYSISRRFSIPLDILTQVNGIQDAAKIRSGTKLLIPDLYMIKKGDTLFGIAKKSKIDVQTILSMNGLKESSILKVGSYIYLPGKNEIAQKQSVPEPEQKSAYLPPSQGSSKTDFFWPHSGSRREMEGKLEGVSFNGSPGDAVFSVSTGKVVWVGPYRGFGKVVFVQSDQGYVYVYAGNETLLVRVGEMVARGQKIGTLGITPYERQSNLLFIVYKDGKPVRPEDAPRI